jgi:thiol-disulfide isomerase/thioredoxin
MSLRRASFVLAAAAIALTPLAAAAGDLKPWTGGATPPLVLKDLAGKEHRLDDYRGKVVVINFWATWCEPCREEMPSLNRLKTQMADTPFAILAVDMGEGEARIKAFLEKTPVDFPVLLDRDSAVSKLWKVRVLPTTLVLDPDTRIRYMVIGELDWSSAEVEKRLRALQGKR